MIHCDHETGKIHLTGRNIDIISEFGCIAEAIYKQTPPEMRELVRVLMTHIFTLAFDDVKAGANKTPSANEMVSEYIKSLMQKKGE